MRDAKRILFAAVLSILIVSLVSATEPDHKNQILSAPSKITLSNDPFIESMVAKVSNDSIISYLQHIESLGIKSPGSPALNSARDWLIAKYQAYGYSDVSTHDFNYSSNTLQNIITTLPGKTNPDAYIIVDGHYDTINGPGVNDNGSGVAVIFEAARVLSTVDFNLSIRFINFSAEEEGLIGSSAYVSNVAVPQNMDIRLVLNIDEVGGVAGMTNNTVTCERDEGPPSGNNALSYLKTDTLAALTESYTGLNTAIAHAYASDYMPFEDAGYTITGFFETNESTHPHSPSDVFANMDPDYVTEIARATVAAIMHFAGAQGKFLELFHAPLTNIEDAANPYPVVIKARSSSTVVTSKLHYSVDSGVFNDVDMLYSGHDGDTLIYNADIPAQAFGSTVDYYFTYSNNDTVSSRLPDLNGQYYSFTVTPDTVAPQIVHDPIVDQTYLKNPIRFEMSALDNNGIASAAVLIKLNDGFEQEYALERHGDKYRYDFSAGFAPADIIRYRFKAIDKSSNQNTAWYPASGSLQFELLNSEEYAFETSTDGFTQDGEWQQGAFTSTSIPQPSGNGVWATVLDGNYSPAATSMLTSPVIDLSGRSAIKLSLEHFYQIEPINDGGNVKISVDGGLFEVIEPSGGYPVPVLWLLGQPGYSGNSYFWLEDEFDLSAYAGHQVQFRFDFRSDMFTNLLGWYIDEFRIDFKGTVSNHAPQITSYFPNSLDSLVVGSSQRFAVQGSDSDGDPLTYQIRHGSNLVSDSVAVFEFNQSGRDTVIASIDDGQGHLVHHAWTFSVTDSVTSIGQNENIVSHYILHPAYPNPFNPETTIRYELGAFTSVKISVYSISGQKIDELVDSYQAAGQHSITFDGSGLASGIYIVKMAAGAFIQSRRLLLMK